MNRIRRPSWLGLTSVLGLLAAAGCGGAPVTADAAPDLSTDGGADLTGGSDRPVDVTAPPEPLSPAAPRMKSWTCPAGWEPEEVKGLGYSLCVPPSLPDTCPEGTRAAAGSSTCVTVGDPCPVGDFADDLPADGVLFVQAGAQDGDGTRALPFGTIAEAITAAGSGDTLALAAGVYREQVLLEKDLRLVGACATETILQPPGPIDGGLLATNSVVELRNVQLRGSETGLLVVGGGDLTVRGLISATTGTGSAAFVDGGRLVVEGAHVSGNDGFYAVDGAVLVLRDTTIEGALGGALLAATTEVSMTRPEVELDGVVIRNTRSVAGSVTSVLALFDVSATLRRSILVDNPGDAFLIGNPERPPVVVAEDLLMAGNGPGHGFWAGDPAHVEIRRALFRDQIGYSILASTLTPGSDSPEVLLEDVAVQGSSSVEVGEGPELAVYQGSGLTIFDGARVELRRALFERTEGGLVMTTLTEGGPTPVVTGSDLVVRQTEAVPPNSLLAVPVGVGLAISGGEATLERVLVEDVVDVGVAALSQILTRDDGQLILPPPTVSLTDLTIRGAADTATAGLAAYLGAQMTVERALIEGQRFAGVEASDDLVKRAEAQESPTLLVLRDLEVRDTLPRPAPNDGEVGGGLGLLVYRARVEVSRSRFLRSRMIGVYANSDETGPMARVTLDGVTIGETAAQADQTFGDGISAREAEISVTNSRVEGSARAALSSYDAVVSFESTVLGCSSFDLAFEGPAPTDVGGNLCLCDGEVHECRPAAGQQPQRPPLVEVPPIGAPRP